MGKYQEWFDSQPKQVQEWMKNQPVWHDSDLFKTGIVGFFIGLLLGLAI